MHYLADAKDLTHRLLPTAAPAHAEVLSWMFFVQVGEWVGGWVVCLFLGHPASRRGLGVFPAGGAWARSAARPNVPLHPGTTAGVVTSLALPVPMHVKVLTSRP